MADRLHDFQRDGFFRQQSQRPVGVSLRRQAQPQGNDFGFLVAVENLSTNSRLRFAVERDFKALGHESLANVFHGFRAAVKRLGDLQIDPVGPLRIRFEQNSGAKHLLRRSTLLLDQSVQYFPFAIREPNNILLLHDPTLLGWAHIDQNPPRPLP